MSARPFLDTNVLIYAYSDDARRSERAIALLRQGGVVSVQVLNEFVDVARRKMRFDWGEVTSMLADVAGLLGPPLPLTVEIHRDGLAISERYGLRIYDSMIVAAARSAGCPTLYTEDLQHGRVLDGVLIENPFATA